MRSRSGNVVDSQYMSILSNILNDGVYKETRSGNVYSLFGLSMRFNLNYGFPMLTTKKMFYRGFIHELLWFLSGDTNIKYLVDNNVNFWTPDAYRFYNELLDKDDKITGRKYDRISMYEFVDKVKAGDSIFLNKQLYDGNTEYCYRYGDLGDVYGHQWRHWGNNGFDQVKMIVDTLRKDPNDRRLLLTGYDPEIIDDVALPPCHTLYQFYTRPLTYVERLKWCDENIDDANEWKNPSDDMMTQKGCPKYALSLWFYCRSQDMPLGNPANIMSAALLLSMVAQCVDMMPYELIWYGGDCHIYENQIDGVKEQLLRDPHMYRLPKLVLNKNVHEIDDFTFDDIKIEDYNCYPAIKMPLSVGLNV